MMIIVSGLPGSGKSYFAERLSKAVGAQYINSDLTRKAMDLRGQYAFEDKLNVYEEMARKAGELLRQGKSVVVDATFYRREMRNLFLTLAKLLHEKMVYFEIVADEKLVRERLAKPRLQSEADFSVYSLVKGQYEPLNIKHLVIESQHNNIDSMLARGLDYVRDADERG